MNNRDFDQDDAEVLAELCGYKLFSVISHNGGSVNNFYTDSRRDYYEEILSNFDRVGIEIKRVGFNRHHSGVKNPCLYIEEGVKYPEVNDVRSYICDYQDWNPWSLEAPMWQIQSLKDAVRQKGLEYEFIQNLWDEIKTSHLNPHTGVDETERGMLVAEALPEAICSAILSLEGE